MAICLACLRLSWFFWIPSALMASGFSMPTSLETFFSLSFRLGGWGPLVSASDALEINGLILEFQRKTMDEIMELQWVADIFRPLYERHLRSIEIIRKKARYSDNTIFFDVSDFDLAGYNKFIPYYLYPEAVYCVGVSLSSYRTKISVGSNPWSPLPRTHNLAALCERYGGGGHPVVGAISFSPNEIEKARSIASLITGELRGQSSG